MENQIKDSHKSLEESLVKIIQLEHDLQSREKEMLEVRRRITEVAELFEKKEIKQHYSFEVLCNFVYDKAKRLFTKFDNAIAELRNVNGQQQSTHIQKRLEAVEADYDELKQVIIKNNQLAAELTQKFAALVDIAPTANGAFGSSFEEGVEKFR